jgi:hypothetical protein
LFDLGSGFLAWVYLGLPRKVIPDQMRGLGQYRHQPGPDRSGVIQTCRHRMPDDEPALLAPHHPRPDSGELRVLARIPQPERDVDHIVILALAGAELSDLAYHAQQRVFRRTQPSMIPPAMIGMRLACRSTPTIVSAIGKHTLLPRTGSVWFSVLDVEGTDTVAAIPILVASRLQRKPARR